MINYPETCSDEDLDALLKIGMATGPERLPQRVSRELNAMKAVSEIVNRLASGRRLTPLAMATLLTCLVRIAEKGMLSTYFLPNPKRGRPTGAKKKSNLVRVFDLVAAAKGWTPEERAPVGKRQLQRIRQLMRGAKGKPGRPRKTDK